MEKKKRNTIRSSRTVRQHRCASSSLETVALCCERKRDEIWKVQRQILASYTKIEAKSKRQKRHQLYLIPRCSLGIAQPVVSLVIGAYIFAKRVCFAFLAFSATVQASVFIFVPEATALQCSNMDFRSHGAESLFRYISTNFKTYVGWYINVCCKLVAIIRAHLFCSLKYVVEPCVRVGSLPFMNIFYTTSSRWIQHLEKHFSYYLKRDVKEPTFSQPRLTKIKRTFFKTATHTLSQSVYNPKIEQRTPVWLFGPGPSGPKVLSLSTIPRGESLK